MGFRSVLTIACFLITILNAESALSEPKYIPAELKTVSSEKIADLKWNNEFVRIRDESDSKQQRYIVMLPGTYVREGWEINRKGGRTIKRNVVGGFLYEAQIDKNKRSFEFIAQGPEGRTELTKILIRVPSWEVSPTPPKPPIKKLFIIPGLGLSSITTTETAISPYSTFALTAKFAANYIVKPKVLDAGITTYITAFQIYKNQPISARYFGFNMRMGYVLPFFETPWVVSMYGGWYYTTTFVQNGAFGYKNLAGPQIYPSVRRALQSGDVLTMYFKFSPVASSLKLLTFSNRELATGFAYIHPLGNGHVIAATLDYSNFKLTFNGINSLTNSLTLGAQYGL